MLSVNLWQGFAQWRRGRLDDALQSVRDATEQIRAWGGTDGRRPVRRGLRRRHPAGPRRRRRGRERGRRGAPLAPADRRGRPAAAPRHRPSCAWRRAGRTRPWRSLDADVGHVDGANPAWAPWRHPAARALAALGRVDEAVALADEQVALLRRWGAPTALGAALRLAGELRGADGAPLLREAVDLLAPTGAALELARARLALGRRPELGDRRGGAAAARRRRRRPATAARTRWSRRPTPRWPTAASGRTRTELVRPRLTGRERQVLDLTARPRRPQVAQRLFLTRAPCTACWRPRPRNPGRRRPAQVILKWPPAAMAATRPEGAP